MFDEAQAFDACLVISPLVTTSAASRLQ